MKLFDYTSKTSGLDPDTTRSVGAGQKTPSFYIRKALKSSRIREKERRLLRSLLHAFQEGEGYGKGIRDEFYSNEDYELTLGDLLYTENEDLFIDFIESVIFSSQESYEAWLEEGFVIEDKKSGAKTIFRAIRNNPKRYRLVISMKNKRGSGVVFKDILTGKTLLPRKWGMVKNLGVGKFYIVRIDAVNGKDKVTRVLSH